MIFESMWPLGLLAAVPVVVLLYLLKPRGKDYRISSNLLWDKLFQNQQSKTFVEKFIHNALMYLQILILMLLVLALMSPYINRQGNSGGNMVLVLDTSGSMQHDTGEGRTRLEQSLEEAWNLIDTSENTAFSIVTSDCTGAELLAVGVRDKDKLRDLLRQVECCDGPGGLEQAQSLVETLWRADQESGESTRTSQVVVYTDGIGAPEAMAYADFFDAQVVVAGGPVDNVANNFLSYAYRDGNAAEGNITCAASITNFSDQTASMEVSLYQGDSLQEVRQLSLGAGETTLCFFQEFQWQGEPLRSQVSSVKFDGKETKDSLKTDNESYGIPARETSMDGVLIGKGNTYIEKAYQAAVGKSLARAESAAALQEGGDLIRIYDAGTAGTETQEAGQSDQGQKEFLPSKSMVFAGSQNASGTVEGVLLTMTACDLTSGMSSFAVGVNETKVYQVPEWGTGFLWAGEECAGYYGEHDGVKTVVLGFDLRESDFPLKAEFPIFMSNAIHFLGDTSLLASNVYTAGERVLFHPQADFDVNTLAGETRKAGLYQVQGAGDPEWYVVRFATNSQSDGRITAEGTVAGDFSGSGLVRKKLRNVLLVLILALTAAEWILYVRQTRYRGRFYLGVRLAGTAMILGALFGLAVHRLDAVNTTVFLVDISNSNEQNLSEMEERLGDALEKMPQDNQYGIVTFGKNSLVEQFLTREKQSSRIMSMPDKTATNFEDALFRALAMIPSGGAGRVVVLTDGRQTKGDLTKAASALAAGQTELLACLYQVEQGQDAYVENVELPGYLYPGDAYTITVTVESNYETDAQIQIWMGSMQTAAYEVHLNRGANQFKFRQEVEGENIQSFQVKVAAAGDTCPENDSYHAYAVVDSAPKVLLVTGKNEDSGQFEALLDSAGCSYSKVSVHNAPHTLEGLLEFRSVILENVFLADLPEGFLENVETYVKDYGCGLVCCGGEDSFALGGYRESGLETVLPVEMELRGVNEVPSTLMIMVIDHSGSMGSDMGSGATSLDLAVEAAKTAVDQMRNTDYVGVIAFDDRYEWIVEPTEASDKEAIKNQIGTIPEGGGTTIQPALWAALKGAAAGDADIRHVILLTDGQGESKNYDSIISGYREADVTLSTVAVGDGSDARLLEQLAEACGGRYYYSDMAEDIPKIFAQEVFLSGDTYLQNGVFGLGVSSSEITRGLFEAGWPSIYGYISATPKHTSRVLISSEKNDPVLSVMQYGLGRTVAWNSDVKNEWTAGFAGQADYVQLWRRIIDYSAGSAGIGEDSVDVNTAGGRTSIVYHAIDYGEDTKVEAVYTDPEGNTMTAPLQATAPGRYEAVLETDVTGIYNLGVQRNDGGEVTNAITTAAAVQYSDEYKFDVGTEAFTSFVERYGAWLEPEENLWQRRKGGTRERYELAPWLILAALLWFVVDIALRRFCFRPQDTKLYHMAGGYLARRKALGGAASRREGRGEAGSGLSGKGTADGAKASGSIPAGAGQEGISLGGRTQSGMNGITGAGSSQSDGGGVDDAASKASGKVSRNVSGKENSAVQDKNTGKSRKKSGKPEPQALDTSALLKKKDQRGG